MEKLKIPPALVLMTAVLGVGAYRASAQESEREQFQTTRPSRPHQKTPAPPLGEALAMPAFQGKLPVGPAPMQALAVLSKDGALLLNRKIVYYQPVTAKNQTLVTSYQQMQYDLVSSYELDAVNVSRIKGDKVETKELRKRLKNETLVVVSADGRPVDPLHLRLYKEDTLVFVLPTPTGRVVASEAPIPTTPPAVPPTPPGQ